MTDLDEDGGAPSTRLDELTRRYEDRFGVHVERLTNEQVVVYGKEHEVVPGLNVWLLKSLDLAHETRSDLTSEEFLRLFRICAANDSDLLVRPQPIEILAAVALLHPPADSTMGSPQRNLSTSAASGLAKRTPGRPAWTRALFEARWEEAYGLTEAPRTIANVADQFEGLDGRVGIDPEHLRDLRSRWRRHELPE